LFFEIGGGQEVAAFFFKVGAAAGTIAKTMSAYDMTFSDAIYGSSPRYVCEERLYKMLDKEYSLLGKRLVEKSKDTSFFAFADTVETLNFKKTNQGHGWIGLRFQLQPGAEANECILHVRLKDNNAIWQQEVLGTIGVNLIFGCYHIKDTEELVCSLVDGFDKDRVEVDMLRFSGPDFDHVDNRLISLLLVKNGLSRMAMFDQHGHVMQPSEALYKKDILILRGRFRPVTHVAVDMMLAGYRRFINEPDVGKETVMTLTEINFKELKRQGDIIDVEEYLHTADLLCSLGQNVLISDYQEYYRLVAYMSQFTRDRKIGVILGIYNLTSVFSEEYYKNLKGGILEAFGILFGRNVKLYVYPSIHRETGEIYHLKDIEISKKQKPLLQYLIGHDKVAGVEKARIENLKIISDNVLEMIRKDEPGWEELLPKRVANAIKAHCLFGYPKEPEEGKTKFKVTKKQRPTSIN
jgi:hypothetical protein